ncbi:MAG: VIT1/CCC1 transporter family protein [Verrucomicrobia bacterium]|nr:VIT1/CCC1 transporter family protein [Verrucomicrobiota bacterium]
MTLPPPSEHFKGKSVVEHLREARTRGAMASAEIHGTEMPGHIAALADASKEIAIALLVLWVIISHFFSFSNVWICLVLFSAGWVIWKTARSALLGWARVERLHRVIEEERWEIEHHRAQERIELTEMYQAKGLSGKLLEEVIDVLMADDNRLLRVMLEEELGLTLEAYEHPLKQAFGALIGSLIGACACLFGLWAFPSFGLAVLSALVVIVSSTISARLERNRAGNTVVWNLAIAGLTAGCIYFLIPLIAKN